MHTFRISNDFGISYKSPKTDKVKQSCYPLFAVCRYNFTNIEETKNNVKGLRLLLKS